MSYKNNVLKNIAFGFGSIASALVQSSSVPQGNTVVLERDGVRASWRAVGQDLRNAIKRYEREEHGSRPRE